MKPRPTVKIFPLPDAEINGGCQQCFMTDFSRDYTQHKKERVHNRYIITPVSGALLKYFGPQQQHTSTVASTDEEGEMRRQRERMGTDMQQRAASRIRTLSRCGEAMPLYMGRQHYPLRYRRPRMHRGARFSLISKLCPSAIVLLTQLSHAPASSS
ncbi:uncharacterized protein LOC117264355 [Epinephelus lanceolatus]